MSKIVDIERLCRLCLDISEQKIILDEMNDDKLMAKIENYTSLKVVKEIYDDPHIILLPQICLNCFDQIKAIDQFRENCIRSDGHLRGLIAEIQLIAMNTTDEQHHEQHHEEIEYLHSDKEIKDDADNILFEEEDEELELNLTDVEQEMDNQIKREIHINKKQKKGRKKCRKDYNIACEICGKTYTKGDMKFHLNAHYGIRPYVCEIGNCEKTFPSPFLLHRHKKVTHCDIKRYSCEICGKMFKQSSVLKFHKSYHGEPQLPCSVCGKMLRNDRAMKKHMMVHTGERPFACSNCNKSFQTAYTLRIHKRVHTNEKPYICSKCGQAYAYNCLLKSHMEKAHREQGT